MTSLPISIGNRGCIYISACWYFKRIHYLLLGEQNKPTQAFPDIQH